TATERLATTWKTARPSLFALITTDRSFSPIIFNGPSTEIAAEIFVDFAVVLLKVTGTVTVSPGLKNLGNAVLITIGSATVIVFHCCQNSDLCMQPPSILFLC